MVSQALFCLSVSDLEQEACVDVERAVAILILDERIATELADGQTILECHDEVLVHNEAQAGTYSDVGTVRGTIARKSHILVVRSLCLRIALE